MNKMELTLDQKGIKQKWLAKQLGKSFNMVDSYVQNKTQPNLETLYRIALILAIEVNSPLHLKDGVEKIKNG